MPPIAASCCSKVLKLNLNEAIMRFWMMLLLALTLGSVGAFFHLHQLIILDGINCTYAAFTLSGLFVLFVSAVWFHSSGNHDFDIIVASERIVAFGIASL